MSMLEALLPKAAAPEGGPWRLLAGVATARLVIVATLALLANIPPDAPILAATGHGETLQIISLFAGLLAIAYLSAVRLKFPADPKRHALIQVLLDSLLIALLVHYTGGQHSPMNALYLLVVLSSAFLLAGRSTSYLAAGIVGFSLLHALLRTQLGVDAHMEFAPLAIFGLAVVATALLSNNLAARLRQSELLAAARGSEILSLNLLNNEIIQHMDLGVIVVNETNHVLLTNPLARRMIDYPEWSELHLPIDAVNPTLLSTVIQCRSAKRHNNDPIVLRSSTQEECLARVRCVPLEQDHQGTLLLLLTDVSQDQAREQQTQLAALGRLTANIAHEIRNPLSAIGHAAQLIQERISDPQMQRLSHIIVRETDRLNQTVESVLELASPRPPLCEEIHIDPWIKSFMEHLHQDPSLADTQLKYIPGKAGLRLLADPAQLQQILWNLVRNASHYGHKEGEIAQIEILSLRENAQWVCIAVRDYGPGIAPTLAARIFEPFFTTSSRGTGLGLSIVRDLVTQNNGRISYHSHPKGGAVFKVILPAVVEGAGASRLELADNRESL